MNKLKERLENGETIIGRGWEGERPERNLDYMYGVLVEFSEDKKYKYVIQRNSYQETLEHFEEIPLKQKLRKWEELSIDERYDIETDLYDFCIEMRRKDTDPIDYEGIVNTLIKRITRPRKQIRVKSQAYCLRWLADNGYELNYLIKKFEHKTEVNIELEMLSSCGKEPIFKYSYPAEWLEDVEG